MTTFFVMFVNICILFLDLIQNNVGRGHATITLPIVAVWYQHTTCVIIFESKFFLFCLPMLYLVTVAFSRILHRFCRFYTFFYHLPFDFLSYYYIRSHTHCML